MFMSKPQAADFLLFAKVQQQSDCQGYTTGKQVKNEY